MKPLCPHDPKYGCEPSRCGKKYCKKKYDGYYDMSEVKKQSAGLSKEITYSDMWEFHVTNKLTLYIQNTMGQDTTRKTIIDHYHQKTSENKKHFHCPDKNVIVFEEKTKSHTNTINKMQRACKNDKYNLFTLQAPMDKEDKSSHFVGYVQYNKTIYLLDPGEENQWGQHITKWMKSLIRKWKKKKFTIKIYSPRKKPQSYNVDIFCQTWSLFLQCEFMNDTWTNIKDKEYDLFDDLIPFIVQSMKQLDVGDEDIEQLIKLDKETDMEYIYYTLKSEMDIVDFCNIMLTNRNLSYTAYYKIPAMGIGLDLDDKEKEFVRNHPLLKKEKNTFKKLVDLQIEQEKKEQEQIKKEREEEELRRRKRGGGGGEQIAHTYMIHNFINHPNNQCICM